MNTIAATFKTSKAARAAYLCATLSPYAVMVADNVVTVGSKDTAETSLIGWFAVSVSNAATFSVIN